MVDYSDRHRLVNPTPYTILRAICKQHGFHYTPGYGYIWQGDECVAKLGGDLRELVVWLRGQLKYSWVK